MSNRNVKESKGEYLIDITACKVTDYERSDTGAMPVTAPAGNYLVML